MKRTEHDTKTPSRRIGRLCAALCGALALLALAASAASAAQDHAFSTTFASPGAEAGRLSLAADSGLALDEETGDLYVADTANHRIDEFSTAGAFIRAFGWEVDASSPEAKLQECTAITGCRAGSAGSEPGQLAAPSYLAVDNDPSSPSHGDLYVADGANVEGADARQAVGVAGAAGGTYTLSFEGQTTAPIPYDAASGKIQEALEELSTIGVGNVFVNGGNVNFRRALGETTVPLITADGSGLTGAGAAVSVTPVFTGARFAPEVITKFGPAGELIGSWGSSGRLAETPTLATGTGRLAQGSAVGTGNLTAGSATVTALATTSGSFEVGQEIEHEGAHACITAVGAGTLTLSGPIGNATGAALRANSSCITGLDTESGAFEAHQTIKGAGIPARARIEEVGPGFLVLSDDTTISGGGVALSAGLRFQQTSALAVDAAGGLWVLTKIADPAVFQFDQAGSFLRDFGYGGNGSIPGASLAVEPGGDFYSPISNGLAKFGPTGSEFGFVLPAKELAGGSGSLALALDPATEDLYAGKGDAVLDISRQCEPSPTGCLPAQEFGAGHLAKAAGLAVAPDGTLYAADTETGQIAVFAVSLEADVQAPTAVKGRSAAAHGTIDPEGTAVTSCSFQYGPSRAYGRSLPCLDGSGDPVGTASSPLTGTTPIPLHADLEGLAPGAAAHYRLHALNTAPEPEEINSEDEVAETLLLPRIEAEEAVGVKAEEATLEAEVDPRGLEVESCRVEWGPTAEPGDPTIPYEHIEPCRPATIPAGSSPVPVSLHLTGLVAGTTYHWRVVAEDADGAERSPDNTFVYLPGPASAEVPQGCANQALRQADGSTALPDCRAYEQVTPPHKNGGLIAEYFLTHPAGFAIATDGSRLIGASIQCFAGSTSCNAIRHVVAADFEFHRSPAGWLTTPIGPPAGQFAGASLELVNPDVGSVLFTLALPATPPLEGREMLYARAADGSLTPIGPIGPGLGSYILLYDTGSVLATADLSRVLYQPQKALWPFDHTTSGRSIYEYAGPAEAPFLVDVGGGPGSTELIGECGAELGSGAGGDFDSIPLALSADGRTVYFTVNSCSSGTGPHNEGVPVPAATLYARIDGEGPGARTVEISGPAPEPACDSACRAEPAAPANFVGASVDGSEVYFTSTAQLTDEASEDGHKGDQATGMLGNGCSRTVGKGGCNLYLYQDPQEEAAPHGHLTDVSAGDTSGQGPQVQGVMAISPDGSHVYFVARGTLTGPNAEGDSPTEGADNLYVYDAAEAKSRFIATLPGDAVEEAGSSTEVSQWSLGIGTANVTPEGDFLLFTSHAGLTPDATRAEGPEQVYRYDAQSEALTRVSIGRRGFDDDGNLGSGNAAIVNSSRSVAYWNGPETANPSISDDGSRVFFTSPLALTPGALDDVLVNSRGHLAQNVYEWEEDGRGSCDEAAGCVYLISDGRDTSEGNGGNFTAVSLIGTDASGEDVFFTTVDPLVPTDTDTESDVYDARVEGGFAPPAQAEPCQGDACKGQGSVPGAEAAPATPGFAGPEEGAGHPRKPAVHHKKRHKHKAKKHGKARGGRQAHGGGPHRLSTTPLTRKVRQ